MTGLNSQFQTLHARLVVTEVRVLRGIGEVAFATGAAVVAGVRARVQVWGMTSPIIRLWEDVTVPWQHLVYLLEVGAAGWCESALTDA